MRMGRGTGKEQGERRGSLMTYKLGKLPINQELALCCSAYISTIQELKLGHLVIYYINHPLQNRTLPATHLLGLLVPDYTAI